MTAVSSSAGMFSQRYRVLDEPLEGRDFIAGRSYTIADISAWGWLDRAARVRKGEADPLAAFSNLKRRVERIDARPAAAGARKVAGDHDSKKVTGTRVATPGSTAG